MSDAMGLHGAIHLRWLDVAMKNIVLMDGV
jgi:hypothetical protein